MQGAKRGSGEVSASRAAISTMRSRPGESGSRRTAQEFPTRDESAGVHREPAQIHRVRAGGGLTRLTPLVPGVRLPVSLAGPAPSGSFGTSRRCRGCCPPFPASPGSGCPCFSQAAATIQWRSPSTSARSRGASWRSALTLTARAPLGNQSALPSVTCRSSTCAAAPGMTQIVHPPMARRVGLGYPWRAHADHADR